jgi:hypothetical protein
VLPPQGGRVAVPLSMKVVRQRLTKVLLLLTFLLPLVVLYFTRYNVLEGEIPQEQFKKPAPPPRQGPPPGQRPPEGINRPGRPGLPAPPPVPPPPPGQKAQSVPMRHGAPGEVLEYQLKEDLNDLFPDIPGGWDQVASALGTSYQFLIVMEADQVRFPFWLGVILLGLTAISWFLHLSVRGAQRSAPLQLTHGPEKPAPRDQPGDPEKPIAVQPMEE